MWSLYPEVHNRRFPWLQASPLRMLEPPFDGEITGKFGPRQIPTRLIPLRDIGPFHAELTVARYYRTRNTFSGKMEGSLDRTGQLFSGQVHGKFVDLETGTVTGTLEGHLFSRNSTRHEPIKVGFDGQIRPIREVSISLEVPDTKDTGITLRFWRV